MKDAIKIKILYTFIMLICFSTAYADEYPILGFDSGATFNNGLYGDWNSGTQYADIETSIRGIDNRYMRATPKTAILDDGIKYIIMYSGANIGLYTWNGVSMTITDSYQVETSTEKLDGDFIVSEIDNKTYIIYSIKASSTATSGSAMALGLLYWNGSTFTNTRLNITTSSGQLKWCTYKFSKFNNAYSTTYSGCPTVLQCSEDKDLCVAVYQTSYNGYSVVSFNSTAYKGKYLYSSGSGTDTGVVALPVHPSVAMLEANDGDAYTDIIFSFAHAITNTYAPKVLSVNMNDTGGLTLDFVINIKSAVMGNGYCRDKTGTTYDQNACSLELTGVLVSEFDGSIGNGKEILVGALTTTNNYIVYELSSIDGTQKDTHPDSFNLEGYFISNPFLTDCYPETGSTDIGIMTYDSTNDEIVMLCSSSPALVGSNEDCEYSHYDINLSAVSRYTYTTAIHPLETDGTDGSEIVTQFGIFDVEEPSFILGICTSDIARIYNWSEPDMYILPTDYEDTLRADLIMADDTNLIYYDDGYSNQNAFIENMITNPCTTENGGLVDWRVNETARISVTITDDELNDVQAKIVLYYGSVYAVTYDWTTLSASGQTIDIDVIANKTIGVGNIRIYARDEYHTDSVYEDITFAVSNDNDSKVYGDCISTFEYDVTVIPEETIDEAGTNINDNTITNSIETFSAPMGLSVSIVYIMVMIIISIGIMFAPMDGHFGIKFGVIGFVNLLMIIIGVKLAIFGVGTMIILAIGGLIILVPFMRSIFTGSSSE